MEQVSSLSVSIVEGLLCFSPTIMKWENPDTEKGFSSLDLPLDYLHRLGDTCGSEDVETHTLSGGSKHSNDQILQNVSFLKCLCLN